MHCTSFRPNLFYFYQRLVIYIRCKLSKRLISGLVAELINPFYTHRCILILWKLEERLQWEQFLQLLKLCSTSSTVWQRLARFLSSRRIAPQFALEKVLTNSSFGVKYPWLEAHFTLSSWRSEAVLGSLRTLSKYAFTTTNWGPMDKALKCSSFEVDEDLEVDIAVVVFDWTPGYLKTFVSFISDYIWIGHTFGCRQACFQEQTYE